MNIFKDDVIATIKAAYQSNPEKFNTRISTISTSVAAIIVTAVLGAFLLAPKQTFNYLNGKFLESVLEQDTPSTSKYLKNDLAMTQRFAHLEELVTTGYIRKFRIDNGYIQRYDIMMKPIPNEDKYIEPEEMENGKACKTSEVSSYTAEICLSYREFKQSMVYLDKYQYTPECLLLLENKKYQDFNDCAAELYSNEDVDKLIKFK